MDAREKRTRAIIMALATLATVFFITTLLSCYAALKRQSLVDQEMRRRMDFEERVLSLSEENKSLNRRLRQLQEALAQSQQALNQQEIDFQDTRQALNQEISRLKAGLEAIAEVQKSLQE